METTYTYSLSGDFPNGLYPYQLSVEIKQTDIAETLNYIQTDGDNVYIVFNNPLSDTEITTLNTTIANHIPQQVKSVILDYYPAVVSTPETNFVKLGRFQHQGYINVGPINGIDLISNMDQGATSYTIQFVCRDTNTTVATKTFTNTETAINTFGSGDIVYQPMIPCVIEVLCMVNNSTGTDKYVHIEEIKVWQ